MNSLFKTVIDLYRRYREIISYLFWGVMTTIVNYVAYFVCTLWFGINYLISNGIAWVIAVIFAFIVNKLYVFNSRSWAPSVAFRECWQFVSARVFSGIMETVMLKVFVDYLHFNDAIIKIIAGFMVVVVNYIFSKLIIFRKKKKILASLPYETASTRGHAKDVAAPGATVPAPSVPEVSADGSVANAAPAPRPKKKATPRQTQRRTRRRTKKGCRSSR